MIIILEGPRGVGKTSISTALESTGFTRIKVQRGIDPTSDMFRMIDSMKDTSKNFVVDRFHLTEFVMSMFFQRREPIELMMNTKRIHHALSDIATIFLLWAAPEILEERRCVLGKESELPAPTSYALWGSMALLPDVKLFRTTVYDSAEESAKQILFLAQVWR